MKNGWTTLLAGMQSLTTRSSLCIPSMKNRGGAVGDGAQEGTRTPTKLLAST